MPKPDVKSITKQAQRTTKALDSKIKADAKALRKAITTLEQRIVAEFTALSVSDMGNLVGPRVNLKKAQALHKKLVKLYAEEYGKTVRSNVLAYNEIAEWIEDNFKEFEVAAEYTDIDKTMIRQLRKQTIVEFTTIAEASQTRIAQAMYNMIATGAPFDKLMDEIKGALTGKVDVRGRPLAQYAEMYANDATMNFYNSVHIEKGRQAGLRHMLYVGDVITTTRDFCRIRAGKVYTIAQINSWEHNWTGKRGPALIYRGGWNCRHHWQAVRKEWVESILS